MARLAGGAPDLSALRERGTAIAQQVVRENAGRWESASERDRERVEAIAQAIVNRLLHEPTLRMKQMADERVHLRMQVVRELFGLEETVDGVRRRAAVGRREAAAARRAGSVRFLMRIGSRGSALALAQASLVAELLGGAEAGVEVVAITTSGDRGALVGDKSRWVKELEAALLAGEIDAAVHSAKDVPGELPDGLALAAVPERVDARDALCGAASLEALPAGARVGTSSLRRAAGLRALRPDLEVVALRGNVDTRLREARRAGDCAAIVLALAGLERLGRSDAVGCTLDELVPAPGQGTLVLEARADDAATRAALSAIDDPHVAACLAAERALARALGASCNTPLGAHAVLADDGAHDAARVPRPARRVGVAARRADGSARRLARNGSARRSRSGCARAGADELLAACEALRERGAAAGEHAGGDAPVSGAGIVHLVGAGPGDPGLLTARALELIATADAILYDRLIPVTALDGARADAELIYVGKEGRGPQMPQEEIDRLLVEHAPRRQARRAAEGRRPVRVRARRRGGARAARGGDPVRGRARRHLGRRRARVRRHPGHAPRARQRRRADHRPREPGQAGVGDRLAGARRVPGDARLLHGRQAAAAHRRAADRRRAAGGRSRRR